MHPLLIIGTPGSGASYVTRLLEDLGLFVGYELDADHRASFMARRNLAILRACGGDWQTPAAARTVLADPEKRERVAESLADELTSASMLGFLGPRRFAAHRTPTRLREPWAFWDPATTILLPIWLRVFPDAALLHVHRSGVDIARYLALLEESEWPARAARRLHGAPSARRCLRAPSARLPQDAFLSIIRGARWIRDAREPRADRAMPRLTLDQGFALWTEYIESAHEHAKHAANAVVHLAIEDLLDEPEPRLASLAHHAGLRPNRETIAAVASTVGPRERFAFRNDPAAMALFERVRSSRWMRRLRYHDLPEK